MIGPLTAYYSTEYHRRNMQVARVCGAQSAVEQALERALTVKSIPVWLIAYLESAASRLPGLQTDLASWRDLAPDAPQYVRADLPPALSAALAVPEVAALVEALRETVSHCETYDVHFGQAVLRHHDLQPAHVRRARAAIAAWEKANG